MTCIIGMYKFTLLSDVYVQTSHGSQCPILDLSKGFTRPLIIQETPHQG